MSTLLVAIPCLNEAKTIGEIIRRIPREIPGVNQIAVLVVDDGSNDGTAEIAAAAGAEVIRHNINRGVGAAFHTALDHAIDGGFSFMVNLDGDGQFDPADISLLLSPILEQRAEMVTASRFKDRSLVPAMPVAKLLGNRLMSLLIRKLCRQNFRDVSCGFRAYSREAMLKLNLQGQFTYTQETFLDLVSKRVRIEEVPIRVQYFPGRKSRVAHNLFRYALNTSSIILRIYRDYFPLRFFMGGALFSLIPSVIFGVMFWAHYLETGRFTGFLYAGLISAFFLLVTLLLILIAVVTDMLDRIRVNQERILYMLKRNRGVL